MISVKTYIEITAACVRMYGWWKTRSVDSTWRTALQTLQEKRLIVTIEDIGMAHDVIETMKGVTETSYHQRLARLLTQKEVSEDALPTLASSVIAYMHWIERIERAKREHYIGTIGETIDIGYVELIRSNVYEKHLSEKEWIEQRRTSGEVSTTVNAYAHQFITQDGALLVSFSYLPLLDRYYALTAIVRKQRISSFSSLKETLVKIIGIQKLPICSLCSKSTTDGSCTCIEVGEHVLPENEFDIELEEVLSWTELS